MLKRANIPTWANHNLELNDSHLIPVSPSTNVVVLSRKELFELSDSLLDTGFKDMGLKEVGPAVNEVLDSKDANTKNSRMANLNSFQREELCKSLLEFLHILKTLSATTSDKPGWPQLVILYSYPASWQHSTI